MPAPPSPVQSPADTAVTDVAPGIEGPVREHSGSMYRVAVSVVRDHSLAEDVVQESMLKAWQALETFRGDASVRTWLLRITHITTISALRKRRDDVIAPEALPERTAHTSVEDSALLPADRDEIWEALRRLDPVSRASASTRPFPTAAVRRSGPPLLSEGTARRSGSR